jgi:FkbM family methyltransferase
MSLASQPKILFARSSNMKAFNRTIRIRQLIKILFNISTLIARAGLVFRNPFSLTKAYINQMSPQTNSFFTRDGYRLILSDNPHDSITVMVIFCRREYGKIPRDSVILDIGANIGIFSIYAARSGAKKVFSFEPNKKAFEILKQNIASNHLDKIVIPFNYAIGPIDGEFISIPKESSPYNRTTNINSNYLNYDTIETISIETILTKNNINKVDLLKMDIEGAEYPILYSMKKKVFDSIESIKLEHHITSEKPMLIKHLYSLHFFKTHEKHKIMWFNKRT